MASDNDARKRLTRLGILPLLLVTAMSIRCTEAQQPDDSRNFSRDHSNGFQPMKLMQPQPAITNAPVIAVDRVQEQVTDDELVLGVEVNGEARAYPINMLTGPRREIINDTLGNIPIAATW